MVDMVFRNQMMATMRYDAHPWNDYFAVLSDSDGKLVLLGLWTHREKTGGWFTLTKDTTVPMQ
jgi:hypothetical protein